MTSRRTQSAVPYTAEQMFSLVADVERYPQFIPYCSGLRVVSSSVVDGQGVVTADMLVAYRVFREQFRSRATLDLANLRIDVEYVRGPFRKLANIWRFEPLPDGDSVVDFSIDFEFMSPVLQAAARAVFERAFEKMSDAFIARADEVYGGA